jgi:hypothetical protein
MQKDLLKELELTPSEFLTEITDKAFFAEIQDDKQATPTPTPTPDQQRANRPNNEQTATPEQNPLSGDKTNLNLKDVLSGELGAEMYSKVISVLCVILTRRFLDIDVPKRQFEFTAGEKSTLAPILEKCLGQLNIDFENPWFALLASTLFITGSKVLDIANNPEFQRAKSAVETKAKESHPAPAATRRDSTGRARPLTRKEGERRGRKPINF